MYLVDVNILVYAMSERDPHHEKAAGWLDEALEGPGQTVGLPWSSPRLYQDAPCRFDGVAVFEDQLIARPHGFPPPRHIAHLERQIREVRPTGKLVPDAEVAALATQHALTVVTADRGFAQFTDVKVLNPLAN